MTVRKIVLKTALAVLFGVSTTAAGAADAFRPPKGREIAATFTGMEFTDQVHFAEVFKRDGCDDTEVAPQCGMPLTRAAPLSVNSRRSPSWINSQPGPHDLPS